MEFLRAARPRCAQYPLMMLLRVLTTGEFRPHHLSRPAHLFHSNFGRVISATHPTFHILKVIPESVLHFFVAGLRRGPQAKAPPGGFMSGRSGGCHCENLILLIFAEVFKRTAVMLNGISVKGRQGIHKALLGWQRINA